MTPVTSSQLASWNVAYTLFNVVFFTPVPSKIASAMAANESIANPTDTLPKIVHVDAQLDVGKSNSDNPQLVLSGEGAGIKQVDGPQFVSTISDAEPIVTRKELWSYYCALSIASNRQQTVNRTFSIL